MNSKQTQPLEKQKKPKGIHSRPTKAVVDLKAYKSNLRKIKEQVRVKIMAIVKANAYGHGAIKISEAAEEIVDFFGVATLEEALELRFEANIKKPILVLGYIDESRFDCCIKNNIRVTIYSYSQWLKWKSEITKHQTEKSLLVHIKINSGMNRLGFKIKEEMDEVIKDIENTSGVSIEGVFTHFATADIPGDSFVLEQEKKFVEMAEGLKKEDHIIHISNSAYALGKETRNLYNMVRIGISSYGLLPDIEMNGKMSVETTAILSLESEIVHIQDLKHNESVGYGRAFTTTVKNRIGVIPIGYADGFLRRYSGNSYVLVNGQKRKIAGRICMDQAFIILGPEDKVGDKVVIYGKQGDKQITLEKAGEWSNTINYEMACLISERVRREYID